MNVPWVYIIVTCEPHVKTHKEASYVPASLGLQEMGRHVQTSTNVLLEDASAHLVKFVKIP